MSLTTPHNPYDGRPWLASYVSGVSPNIEIPNAHLGEMITETALKFKDKIAYTVQLDNGMNASLTFAEVEEYSNRFAAFLLYDLKLQKGDRVAIQMPNCLAYPICAFGILKAGCVVVNVNPLYTTSEMEHQLNDSGAKVLLAIDLLRDKLDHVLPQTKVSSVICVSVADFFPILKRTLVKTMLKLKKKIPKTKIHSIPFSAAMSSGAAHIAKRKDDWQANVHVGLDDLAALQYTGGTTGVSKGAMLTHKNLLANVYQITNYGGPKFNIGSEVVLTVLPLYHIFAFTINCLTFFNLGARNVLIPNPRPISNLRLAFQNLQITWITGVNTLYSALLGEAWFQNAPPKSVKMSIAGGSQLHKSVQERWEKLLNSPLAEGYGLTEGSPVIAFNPIGGLVKSESIGIAIPSTEMWLVDDDGKPVPIGEPGELIARGPQIMAGYWQHPEETANVLKKGWLYTGDIAIMDSEGYFRIVDRKKEMILVSGFNVYPNEIEDCISKHSDVLEVAVIGIPDNNTGEAVKAYVVSKNPNLTPEDLKAHCKNYLTNYKVPKKIEFRQELPKSSVGKILRKDLRKELQANASK